MTSSFQGTTPTPLPEDTRAVNRRKLLAQTFGAVAAAGLATSSFAARKKWGSAPAPAPTTAPAPAPTVAPAPAPTAAPAPAPSTTLSAQETGQLPIITEGQLITPESHWNDPSVIAENGGYTMYASCLTSWTTMDIRIYRLRSTDRVNWTLSPSTPVLVHGATGTWDQKAVETPSVVKFNGMYHMFYTGYPGDYSASKEYKIGHAYSSDGINWTKDASFFLAPTAPTNASPTMDFRQWVCAEPGAVVVGNKLHVYFTAVGAVASVGADIQTIGVTIYDPALGTWSAPQLALVPDQTLYPRSVYYGFSTPAAGVVNGQVVLTYSIVTLNPWKQVGVGNAMSADGLTGWRYNTFPVIERDAAWRSNECRAPAILQDAAGTHLFFAGDDGGRLSIGYRKLA